MNASTAVPDVKAVATLAGGCFWCLEAVYDGMKGVISVESGYMGGKMPNPTYEQVCGGDTGHAEVVRITFDPAIVSFKELLEVFFVVHDPTTLNYQGNAFGTQYRSASFYHAPQQKADAEEVIARLRPGSACSACRRPCRYFFSAALASRAERFGFSSASTASSKAISRSSLLSICA